MMRVLSALVTACVLLALGCGSLRFPLTSTVPVAPAPLTPVSKAVFGYLLTDKDLYSYSIAKGGLWTPTAPAQHEIPFHAQTMATAPNGNFLYVAGGIASATPNNP